MQTPTQITRDFFDSGESLRQTSRIVGVWILALLVLPPTGLLWQFPSLGRKNVQQNNSYPAGTTQINGRNIQRRSLTVEAQFDSHMEAVPGRIQPLSVTEYVGISSISCSACAAKPTIALN